ncbi:hypothetical protein U1Q18_013950, partial [Sarracenia purpurea var. burkii]
LEEGCFSGIGGFRVAQNPEAARSGNYRNLLVVAKASREPQAASSTSPKPPQKTRAAAKCLPNKGVYWDSTDDDKEIRGFQLCCAWSCLISGSVVLFLLPSGGSVDVVPPGRSVDRLGEGRRCLKLR